MSTHNGSLVVPQFGELVQDSRDDRLHHCELTKQKTSVMYGPC